MLRLSALSELEETIARSIEAYFAAPAEQRGDWVRTRFGRGYPADCEREIVRDIIADAINQSRFRSTFECSECGRIALADPPGRDAWVFYEPVPPAA
jgi:hypothetical protein